MTMLIMMMMMMMMMEKKNRIAGHVCKSATRNNNSIKIERITTNDLPFFVPVWEVHKTHRRLKVHHNN